MRENSSPKTSNHVDAIVGHASQNYTIKRMFLEKLQLSLDDDNKTSSAVTFVLNKLEVFFFRKNIITVNEQTIISNF